VIVSPCHPEEARSSRPKDPYDNPRDSSPQEKVRGSERHSKKDSMSKEYYVYIMTNKSRTLYTGVTNNLMRRVYEHKNKLVEGFTKKYNIQFLVYYESTSDINSAIAREKEIKGWLRKKKIALIDSVNPQWKDLSKEWIVDRKENNSKSS
jgi:putative endonuclease